MNRACNIAILLVTSAVLMRCETTQKNRNVDYVPGCVTETDPNCVGEVTGGIQIPLPQARDKSKPKGKSTIFGQCELVVEGEDQTKPCDGIKLVVRSVRENEVRTATFDGYNFKIEDLNKDSYNLEAASPNYDVVTDTKALSPGQTVKIRVKARPKK